MEAQIVERDFQDSTREIAPLVKADDATELISDGMTIEQVIDALEDLFRCRVVRMHGNSCSFDVRLRPNNLRWT